MTLQIADHPVTDAERRDLLLLLDADVRDYTCDCACQCDITVIGGGQCGACEYGDCLMPEAGR